MIVMMMPSTMPTNTVAEYRRTRLNSSSFRPSFNQYINGRVKTCKVQVIQDPCRSCISLQP